MGRLNKVETDVRNILEIDKQSREDDMYLYYIYCYNKIPIDAKVFYGNDYFRLLFKYKDIRTKYNIAPFDSVGRCRRKLQQKFEHLRSTKQLEKLKSEVEYIEYSRED